MIIATAASRANGLQQFFIELFGIIGKSYYLCNLFYKTTTTGNSMKKTIAIFCLMLCTIHSAMAQRFTDKLDRGLVVVPTGSTSGSTTNFVSWRRLADEYYGVTYNLYKNGTRIASNLTTTSYNDNSNATTTTQYQVAAVVNGAEQSKCAAMMAWGQYI